MKRIIIDIHKAEDGYVVAENGTWLPGIYESEDAARYATMFSNKVLKNLQTEPSYIITYNDLKTVNI